jgi:hypothetical protein
MGKKQSGESRDREWQVEKGRSCNHEIMVRRVKWKGGGKDGKDGEGKPVDGGPGGESDAPSSGADERST